MKARGDYGAAVEKFFDSLNEPVATSARELRGIIVKPVPKVCQSIGWGMPVHEEDGLTCAIRPGSNYVALQFCASGEAVLMDNVPSEPCCRSVLPGKEKA